MIIEAFNGTYFLLLGLIIAASVVITLLLQKKSEDVRRKVLLGICLLNVFVLIIYKFGLWYGTYGLPDTYAFEIWAELPLHLCNISLILAPLSIAMRNKNLMGFCFFVSPLGAFFAMSFPSDGFYNASVFAPHMIGYYGTHAIVIIVGMLLVTLGLYSPRFKEIPKLILFIAILSALVFGINVLIFQTTGVRANYFYTVTPEGISILELFWSWLPIPYLYLSFAMIIFLVYVAVVMIPITIVRAVKGDAIEEIE